MSEISDLTDALNNLRQGITDGQHSGGGGGVAAGATAALAGGVIEAGNLGNALKKASVEFYQFLALFGEKIQSAVGGLGEFGRALRSVASVTQMGLKQSTSSSTAGPSFWDRVKNNWAVLMEKMPRAAYPDPSNFKVSGFETPLSKQLRTEQDAREKTKNPLHQWQSLDIGMNKASLSMSVLTSWITKGSLALAGMVAVGLKGTVEGYKLTLAFERMAYSLANLLKPVVDLVTGLFNHAAAEINFIHKRLTDPSTSNLFEEPTVNRERDYVSRLREIDEAEKEGKQLYNGGIGPFAIKESYEKARERAKEEALRKPGALDFNLLPPFGIPEAMTPEREEELRKGYKGLKSGQGAEEIGGGKRKNQDSTYTFTTTFSSLTSLWENMNKAVTEKPPLDVVKSWLEEKLSPAIDKYMETTPDSVPASSPIGT